MDNDIQNSAVNTEVAKDEPAKDINPLVKIRYASLSGRSQRKLKRQNTAHWIGKCPECGGICRYHKNWAIKKKDIWICSDCKKAFDKEALKDGRYF